MPPHVRSAVASQWIAGLLALLIGVLHVWENYAYVLHVRNIPDEGLAQVASLQTENAFYYSYYVGLVEAESVRVGLEDIIWDRRSEFPDVLNALRRFNIYQEVVMALLYRVLRSVGLSQLLGAWAFFRWAILVLNGFGHAALALLASELSGNPFAGVACFVVSFLNRFQISRLGSFASSNLREIWGIPILWMQVLALCRLISGAPSPAAAAAASSRLLWRSFAALTVAFIVVWQFSPFLLLLQATAVYFVYLVCGYRSLRSTVVGVIDTYLLAMAVAVVVHFGSPYLLTSPFLFQLLALKAALSACSCPRRRLGAPAGGAGSFASSACARWAAGRLADLGEGLLAVGAFAAVWRAAAPFATADTHVYDILCTKVSAINELLPGSFRLPDRRLPHCAEPSFNARLYLVMGVFKLLEKSSVEIYYKSSASPAAATACALVVARCILGCLLRRASCAKHRIASEELTSPGQPPEPPHPAEGTLRRRRGGRGGESRKEAAAPPERLQDEGREKAAKVEVHVHDHETGQEELREEAALLFFAAQFLLFLALGCLINRLRVAFGPPMMVLASMCSGPRLFLLARLPRWGRWLARLLLGTLFLSHVYWMLQRMPCIVENDGVCQHFSDKSSNDGDLADLCDWINHALEPGTPMLSSMNVAGTLRLFTGVSLIIHPQFESENLRKRVQMGYELYHCGSEESFLETVQHLRAETVVFEHARCFFTPYLLDDRRKNCNKTKHKPEDQLCIKLHARSRHFRLLFTNGGYSVFGLRPGALPGQGQHATTGGDAEKPSAAQVSTWLSSPDTWREYVAECAAQVPDCGARLMEASAAWHHGLRRQGVAKVLRALAEERFPEDGYVAFYLARYWDYDKGLPKKAKRHYAKAVEKLPNNAKVLQEYLMYLDMALQDSQAVAQLLRSRMKAGGPGRPLLDLAEGGGAVAQLLCEAAVSARGTEGLRAFGDEMWEKARRLAPMSTCVKHNWPLIYGEGRKYDEEHDLWSKVRLLVAGGVQHEVGSHHQPPVRFLGHRPFILAPPSRAGPEARRRGGA